ncbi:MAG: mandelate racemase/muconate lactonizing enzyme family protein [Spirochaetota bacterium]
MADSTHSISHWGVVGARLTDENGTTGYGFTGTHAHLPSDRIIADAISTLYAPLLVSGGELAEYADLLPSAVYRRLFRYPPLQWVGRAGITQLALSAVDIALWDLYAKRHGVPLWRLLGGTGERKITAYNTDIGWLSFSRDRLVENAEQAVENGFRALKLKVGGADVREDADRCRAVRHAVGDNVLIATDANGRWDLPTAQRFSRAVRDLDILWIEEPLWHDDVEAHAELAGTTSLPIALGEQIYTPEGLSQFISRRALHFVQPDATRIGGVSGFLQAAAHARAMGLPVAAHAGEMSQVHRHLALALPHHTILEYIPWIAHAFTDPATVEEGAFLPPSEPGAGTTPTPEAIATFRAG